MSNDSIKKTVIVAIGVCIVCSILVSTAAVALKPRQEKNKKMAKIVNILKVGGLFVKGQNMEEVFKQRLKPAIIELKTGKQLTADNYDIVLNPENFNIKKVAKHPDYSETISGKDDLPGIKRKPRFVLIYYVIEKKKISKIILPIYGKGLWSTLYGFLALNRDLRTISGITFYDHGETPGLGGEIDNPKWKELWKGKLAFNENYKLKIEVIKGRVDNSKRDYMYKIDGLSGSTLTTRGVNNLVRFWLSDNGYGPFLKKFREEGINGQI